MKDRHIHVEKSPRPGFGRAAVRALIAQAVGLVPNLPKTVGTGAAGAVRSSTGRQQPAANRWCCGSGEDR